MHAFPSFDPSRTTLPMFNLMLKATNREQVPDRADVLNVPKGQGMNALNAMFERITKNGR